MTQQPTGRAATSSGTSSGTSSAPSKDGLDDGPWLVVGMGNPGPGYAGNRHNAGAMVLDTLAAELRERFGKHRSGAEIAEVRLPPANGRPGPRLVLAKPTSYMNVSGGPVNALLRFFRIEPDHLLVVHDELDIPFGDLRLKRGGGEGGHNGLRSISQAIGTKEYCRLRFGIGRPPGRMDAADYVLKDFSGIERKDLPLHVAEGAEAVREVAVLGWEKAQARLHTISAGG